MLKSKQSSIIGLIFGVLKLAIQQVQGMISVLFSVRGVFFFSGACAGFLVWVYPVLWSWFDRPISQVQVYTDLTYLEKDEVKKLLQPYVVGSFLFVDIGSIQKKMRENNWVEQVSVRKVWPDVLKIKLAEKTVVAKWQGDALISSNGEVFYPDNIGKIAKLLPEGLTTLSGKQGSEQKVMSQYMALSSHLRSLNLRLSEIKETSLGEWIVTVDSVRLLLGRKMILERIARFNLLYRWRLRERWQDIKQVDLRYRDGAAVTWKQSDLIE